MDMHKIKRKISILCDDLAKKYPVISITGPRQSGKTTFCKDYFPELEYANLEDLEIRDFAASDPKGFLAQFSQGGIIDEIQRVPTLTSYIQVRVDEDDFEGLFVLTGSQDFAVKNTLSQSLAGRVAILTLLPFNFFEVSSYKDIKDPNELLYQGFYPRIHHRDLHPTKAYSDYVATYLERDLRQLELVKNIDLFQKFLRLIAGRVGNILNLQSLSNDVGVAQSTARQWVTLLEASYILYRLPPFYENLGKRLIKSPKI